MKTLQPCTRFSFFCLLFIVVTAFITGLLNLILRFFGDSPAGIAAAILPYTAIPASFSYLLLFILPGLLVVGELVKRELVNRKYILLISITLSSLLAYIVFWIYYFNHIVGRVSSIVILLFCIILFFYRFKSLKEYIKDTFFLRPLTLCFMVGCLYLGILLLYYTSGDVAVVANDRFTWSLPADNHIPRMVFDIAYNGLPLHSLGDYWFVSDRPPLATAMLLLLHPVSIFIADQSLFYQFFGTYVQLLWIPVLYYLCDFFSFSKRLRNFIISCAVFSGVFLINSVYIWPKLSTTVYFCLVLFLIFELADEKKNTTKAAVSAILIGISAVMAILTHGGIMFSLLTLGLAVLICEKRARYNYRDILYTFGSFAAIYAPWHIYAQNNDPGGNKLLKLIFAGPGMEGYPLGEAVVRYYTETPLRDIFTSKLVSFLDIFAFDVWDYVSLDNLRLYIFAKAVATATVLNIFLLIAIFYFIYRYGFMKEKLSYNYRIMLWFTILSFTVWPLITYNATILYQGSYFNLMLLFLVIAIGVKHTEKIVANTVFIANILLFFILFIVAQNTSISQSFSWMNIGMFVLVLTSAAAYFTYTYKFDTDIQSEMNTERIKA